jgi:hypothetical protein
LKHKFISSISGSFAVRRYCPSGRSLLHTTHFSSSLSLTLTFLPLLVAYGAAAVALVLVTLIQHAPQTADPMRIGRFVAAVAPKAQR